MKAGDYVRVRLARNAWLAMTEAVRKADAQLAEHQKEMQDLIPRETVEAFLKDIGRGLNVACRQGGGDLAIAVQYLTLGEIAETLRRQMLGRILDVAAAIAVKPELPLEVKLWASIIVGSTEVSPAWWSERAESLGRFIAECDDAELENYITEDGLQEKERSYLKRLEEWRSESNDLRRFQQFRQCTEVRCR